MALRQIRHIKNRLALFRRRRSLGSKQVAALLGHRSTVELSRYESGIKVPNLKIALKLAAIYDIPIRIMLDGYYEACLAEVRKEQKHRAIIGVLKTREGSDRNEPFDACALEDMLCSKEVDSVIIDKAKRHVTDLIRLTAEKLGHLNPRKPNNYEKA